MNGSALEFYADRNDLVFLFAHFDQVGVLICTRTVSGVNCRNEQFQSLRKMIDFTVSPQEPVQANTFLITSANATLHSREIRMQDGTGVKIVIDELRNPDAIEILLGGEAGSATLVTTTLRTRGLTSSAKELFKTWKKFVLKNSVKVGANYYVMSGAYEKLSLGWRLTPGIGYSQDLDLRLT